MADQPAPTAQAPETPHDPAQPPALPPQAHELGAHGHALGTQVHEQAQALGTQVRTWTHEVRRHSLSMLVPMGQEFAYRYQEALIANLLYALRAFRDRLER